MKLDFSQTVTLRVQFYIVRSRRRRNAGSCSEGNKEHIRILDSNNSNNGTLGTTPHPQWVQGSQYTDEGIGRDIRSPALGAGVRGSGGRPAAVIQSEQSGQAAVLYDGVDGDRPQPCGHRNPTSPRCDLTAAGSPLSTFRPPRTPMYDTPSFKWHGCLSLRYMYEKERMKESHRHSVRCSIVYILPGKCICKYRENIYMDGELSHPRPLDPCILDSAHAVPTPQSAGQRSTGT